MEDFLGWLLWLGSGCFFLLCGKCFIILFCGIVLFGLNINWRLGYILELLLLCGYFVDLGLIGGECIGELDSLIVELLFCGLWWGFCFIVICEVFVFFGGIGGILLGFLEKKFVMDGLFGYFCGEGIIIVFCFIGCIL